MANNPVSVIASLISSDPCNSPEQLLYDYLAENAIIRLNDFQQYCSQFGVDLFAEDILKLLEHEPNYMFVEASDDQGRYWQAEIYEGYVPRSTQAGPDGPGDTFRPDDPYDMEQGHLTGIDTDVPDDIGHQVASHLPGEEVINQDEYIKE